MPRIIPESKHLSLENMIILERNPDKWITAPMVQREIGNKPGSTTILGAANRHLSEIIPPNYIKKYVNISGHASMILPRKVWAKILDMASKNETEYLKERYAKGAKILRGESEQHEYFGFDRDKKHSALALSYYVGGFLHPQLAKKLITGDSMTGHEILEHMQEALRNKSEDESTRRTYLISYIFLTIELPSGIKLLTGDKYDIQKEFANIKGMRYMNGIESFDSALDKIVYKRDYDSEWLKKSVKSMIYNGHEIKESIACVNEGEKKKLIVYFPEFKESLKSFHVLKQAHMYASPFALGPTIEELVSSDSQQTFQSPQT